MPSLSSATPSASATTYGKAETVNKTLLPRPRAGHQDIFAELVERQRGVNGIAEWIVIDATSGLISKS